MGKVETLTQVEEKKETQVLRWRPAHEWGDKKCTTVVGPRQSFGIRVIDVPGLPVDRNPSIKVTLLGTLGTLFTVVNRGLQDR